MRHKPIPPVSPSVLGTIVTSGGSAKDGSLSYFIEGTRPEGLAADELGNIFGGLTGGCEASRSGGCLQKFVKR